MKTLIVIRHAKAVQSFGRDKNRNLTERGHQNAAMMALKLLGEGYVIDMIFASPAVRTRQTAEYFALSNHLNEDHLKFFDKLYLGDTLAIAETIRWLKEDISTLAVVGHNPGVSNFVSNMTSANIGDLPTCGIAVIQLEMNSWEEDFYAAPKRLLDFITPKEI